MLFGLWEGNTFYDFLMDNSHCNKKKSQSTQCTDTNTHTHTSIQKCLIIWTKKILN